MPGSWLVVSLSAVLGFFVGAVSPATIMARARQVDLRQGSGNPGATNVGRVLGVRWGVAVGLLDVEMASSVGRRHPPSVPATDRRTWRGPAAEGRRGAPYPRKVGGYLDSWPRKAPAG